MHKMVAVTDECRGYDIAIEARLGVRYNDSLIHWWGRFHLPVRSNTHLS